MHAHMRPRMPTTYSVVLKIGRRQFRGNGPTRQQARHNAASRALKVLKNIQLHPQTAYNPNQKCTDDQTAQGSDGETAAASNSGLFTMIFFIYKSKKGYSNCPLMGTSIGAL